MNATLRTGLLVGAVAAAQIAGARIADAQSLLLDFGTDTTFRGLSTASPDGSGNHWNNIATGVFYVDMVDTTGAPTTLDFGFSTPVGTDSYNGPAGPTDGATLATDVLNTDIDAAALGDLGELTAAFDFMAERNVRFEIQGLDPSKLYDLEFFGSHKFDTDAATTYTVFTDNTYSTAVATTSLNVFEPGSPWLHNRDTVATLSGVAPQTSDILYVEFTGADGGYGYLNAMKITAVPEPASALIAAFAAGFGLVGRRVR